ncbi:MAG: hypothetical protein PHD57_00765 [Desulfobacterales bacterium]|nr:hypothetical protein [Desulfobacterales bacterium]MDD3081753.1 hypothetical protein [Desulfobacterales bacterium]MDD3950777.1 hypothetical protein [Desulfobacterales bacterium]MDD4463250.1 hypothetical protein [Desulfobacterales bacterium]
MRIDSNPMYRKIIVPWYDSDRACLFGATALSACLVFGLLGFHVAIIEYPELVWLPILLTALSGLALISVTARLIKRSISNPSQ